MIRLLVRYANLIVTALFIYGLVSVFFLSMSAGFTALGLALIAALLHEIHQE